MNDKKSPIAVLGAGSWGSALALLLASNGHPVRLYGNDAAQMQVIAKTRTNPDYLPDVTFPELIECFSDLTLAMQGIEDILLVVPSHVFPSVIEQLSKLAISNPRLIWATKGLHPETGEVLANTVQHFFPKAPIAVLSGPSFAKEVAKQLPTAVTLACVDKAFAQRVRSYFHNDKFRVYLSEDLIGVQLCGAVKNVLAIATGMSDGLGFGANARAALITRGLAEMTRLGLALGAQQHTFMGLAGMGDLVLTCTDDQSRNRRFGLALGKGQTADEAHKAIGQVVEGAHNVEQVMQLAKQYQLDMPISEQVFKILNGQETAHQAVHELLSRAPKSE